MFKINKLESDVVQLRREMIVVREELSVLHSMNILLETLVSKVSMLPEPPREAWERHSCPAWEQETISIPAVHIKRVSRHLALLDAPPIEKDSGELEPPPACPIERVVVCIYGDLQYILALGKDNRKIEYYSGWAQANRDGKPQLLITLDAFGENAWEIAKVGSPEWNSVYEAMSA